MAENQYAPDTVSPPGETLRETLDTIGMAPAKLAARMGRTEQEIGALIEGKAVLTPKIADELERILEIPASFWNNREQHYRESLAHRADTHPTTAMAIAAAT